MYKVYKEREAVLFCSSHHNTIMPRSYKLLLAEDDETLGYLLKEYLQLNDFDVEWKKNGEDALKEYKTNLFSIAVVDVMMPVKDGLTLLDDIKTIDPLFPVIVLTSKNLKVDKLKGFKKGADDYIIKPVDKEELVKILQAVLRRSNRASQPVTKLFAIGEYIFDPHNQLLTYKNERVALSQKESALLQELCDHIGRVFETKFLLQKIWGKNDFFTKKSMEVFIYKLRKHLKKDHTVKIKNVHGKGYMLEISDQL